MKDKDPRPWTHPDCFEWWIVLDDGTKVLHRLKGRDRAMVMKRPLPKGKI